MTFSFSYDSYLVIQINRNTVVELIVWTNAEFFSLRSGDYIVGHCYAGRPIHNPSSPIHNLPHDHPHPVRHDLTDQRWLMVILYFFHFWEIAPTAFPFPQSFLLMVFWPIPAMCRAAIMSLMSFDRSLVWPMLAEWLEWKKLTLWTCLLYTHN